jgi:hypothetical protein
MKYDYHSCKAFNLKGPPNMTLRSGHNIDRHCPALPFDPNEDNDSGLYLNKYACGLTYLDFSSWEYYAPIFMKHILDIYAYSSDVASESFLRTIEACPYNIKRINMLDLIQKKTILIFLNLLLRLKHSYYIADLIDDWKDMTRNSYSK